MWLGRFRAFTTFKVKVEMSSIDLQSLSVDELKVISAQASELIQNKEDTLIRDAYEKIKKLADSVNMTVDQMAVWGNNQSRKRKQVKVKYRNPANPKETWTGRGIEPRWLQREIEQGKKPADFLVDVEAAA